MKLSIIIPLYNEEGTILEILNKFVPIQFPEIVEYKEIIIVDDCSSDNSYKTVEDNINKFPINIKLFKHLKNQGKGTSVHTGIQNAIGDVFFIQDADLEYDPRDILKMIDAMQDLKIEFINGSRYIGGVYRTLSSFRRYLGNKFFTFLVSILIDVRITDVACCYKLFTKELYNKLHLKEKGFAFESEFTIKALRIKKNNIAEIPVKYFPRDEGEGKKLRNKDAFVILWAIFKYGLLRLN
jgi:glycosyltransferase involved in cell wall biosynthesis